MDIQKTWRKTTQYLAPARLGTTPEDGYELYPGFPIGSGKVFAGYDTLARELVKHRQVIIDGYGGVFWSNFRQQLQAALEPLVKKVDWVDVHQAFKSEAEILEMITPYLGGDDPIFGTRFPGKLADFFDPQKLTSLQPQGEAGLRILYGPGAALAGVDGFVVYLDVPKNEIQFRSRAGAITNLGAASPDAPKKMYKRFYFVDWPALNRHKAEILPRIDLVVDEQRPDEITWMRGDDLREGLRLMANNYFRVRPWFEPGPWGGQWIKENIPGVADEVPNYAWSFEMISPENGILFKSDDLLLEVSFDFLMFQENRAILAKCAERFGYEFPIRFDFLDTVDGGNLSIQVHPSDEYIRKHFGETFTQDETYYILEADPDATVYIGFEEGINPDEFRRELERSFKEKKEVDIPRFVKQLPSKKHDLFLIPNGTIHGSGRGNVVLEISATPYIFTFKLYDWLRLDLDGNPRPLNIERGFENLRFERSGRRVEEELVSHPEVKASGDGWRVIHLPTHPQHFFDVDRLEFEKRIDVETDNSVHVLMLVEGEYIYLETANGMRQRFNYAETFCVPAAAAHYRLVNEAGGTAKVVKAYMKPDRC